MTSAAHFPLDPDQVLRLARETFDIEAAALTGLAARLDGHTVSVRSSADQGTYQSGLQSFIAEARALRGLMLKHPPGHIQRTMAYFLGLGHYDALINRMRTAYRRRRQVMEEAIAAQGLTVAGQGGFGGSSFWMRAGCDTEALAADLRGQGVLIEPGRAFFDPGRPDHQHYRLGYSSIAPARIGEGIARIARAMG